MIGGVLVVAQEGAEMKPGKKKEKRGRRKGKSPGKEEGT